MDEENAWCLSAGRMNVVLVGCMSVSAGESFAVEGRLDGYSIRCCYPHTRDYAVFVDGDGLGIV